MLESFPAWFCVFLCRGCKWGRNVLFFIAPSMRNVLDVMPGSLPCMVASLRGGNMTILSKTPVSSTGDVGNISLQHYRISILISILFLFILQSTKPCKHYTCILTCLLQIVYDFIGANFLCFCYHYQFAFFFAALRRKIRDRLLIYHSCIWKLLLLFCLFFIYANHFLST